MNLKIPGEEGDDALHQIRQCMSGQGWQKVKDRGEVGLEIEVWLRESPSKHQLRLRSRIRPLMFNRDQAELFTSPGCLSVRVGEAPFPSLRTIFCRASFILIKGMQLLPPFSFPDLSPRRSLMFCVCVLHHTHRHIWVLRLIRLLLLQLTG